ncbi:hypothetical protein EDD86DRAFT_57354 [Gorgonomyces haynaldii]|nr:hypothetical protein EDD86DRAFT_57354 [Gorgonomyces haynaldii]
MLLTGLACFGSVNAVAINTPPSLPSGHWTTPSGLNVTVAAPPSDFAEPDRTEMQKMTVVCPNGRIRETFLGFVNATDRSPKDMVNNIAESACQNVSATQLPANASSAAFEQLWENSNVVTFSRFQFYEASQAFQVPIYYQFSNILSIQIDLGQNIEVPFSIEKIDKSHFSGNYESQDGDFIDIHIHLVSVEGPFRWAYQYRMFGYNAPGGIFRPVLRYVNCDNDYGWTGNKLPAWQDCDLSGQMQHNVGGQGQGNPPSCPKHGHWDAGQNRCVCDGDFAWDGSNCIYQKCPKNGHWEVGQDKCVCNGDFVWSGQACIYQKCPRHGHWDVGQNKCVCDNGWQWDGSNCISTMCPRHSHYDVPQDRCICDNGWQWDGSNCVSTMCPRHSHYDVPQDRCICDNGYNWDGSQCALSCPANSQWNVQQDKCVCNDGFYLNGNVCVLPSCPAHAHFNLQTLRCDCDNGYVFSNAVCVKPCADHQHYDQASDKCVCDSGYRESENVCYECPDEAVWQVNAKYCDCGIGRHVENGACKSNPSHPRLQTTLHLEWMGR